MDVAAAIRPAVVLAGMMPGARDEKDRSQKHTDRQEWKPSEKRHVPTVGPPAEAAIGVTADLRRAQALLWVRQTTDVRSGQPRMAPVPAGATLDAEPGKEHEMKILVAYDGSESAQRALERAAELASSNGSSVSVISVAEPLPQFGRAASMMVPEEEDERKHELADAKSTLAGKGIEAAVVERMGDPATMIVDEAEQEGSDVIVIGTRGLSTAKRWLMGSVSSRVVQHAPCNVLVVR
jgi:nucleotide-binding universal stress UspA family protein